MTVGVIVGSSFSEGFSEELGLVAERVETAEGATTLHRTTRGRAAWCLFRHGLPHQLLPQHIPWRANALALKQVGVRTLLVTSSVGVLDAQLPLYRPLLVSDLLMLENRLPDGTLCTIYKEPAKGQGHLVLEEGLFSRELDAQVRRLADGAGVPLGPSVTFGYAAGPRTKTPAENAAWARLGAQVNSMTLGPEVVLANELELPCSGLVVGHKYSLPRNEPSPETSIAESLVLARTQLERLVGAFLDRGEPVAFKNSMFRFGG